ncbi:MAG: ABC transporter ATP-binding protein [Bacilli bacterium]|nr:ABC transporter ATP-binding protein [Bacilli bacterium]
MIKLLNNFNKKDWLIVIFCFVLICLQVWLELKMPDYMSEITVLVQTEGSKMKDIIINGSYMLMCAMGSMLATIATGYLIACLSAGFSRKIRKKLFDKVLNLSMEEVKKFKTSSLITRTTNDITQVEMLIGLGLLLMIKSPITALWAIFKIYNKSWQWSAVTGIAVVILLSVVTCLVIIVVPRFKIVQRLTDKINDVTRENLTGIRVVRAFNASKYQEDKFNDVNNNLTNQQLFNQKAFAILSPIMYFVMHSLALSIYFIGSRLIDGAMLSDKLVIFGDMIVFSSYAMQIIMSFLMLAFIFVMLPRANVSAKRINEVIDTDISIVDGQVVNNKNKLKGVVEFKNVSFKYPDAEEYLLKNISFKVNKGETVAFIGSTGSGKSTLINLVPRFYDATDGEILIDGVNVKEYSQESLHDKLGYVSQKAVIFSGTIKSNINYGKNRKRITDKKIKEAVKVAQAKDFVEKMDNKYDTHIAQGGTNISGGQKQRLAIARAIARDPEIYIFDDSFSALDYKTDSVLRRELKKYTKDATSLIVAQRIGTIMNADKIIVLDNGECVGMGTHKELLASCEVYKQIALSQLKEEELYNE